MKTRRMQIVFEGQSNQIDANTLINVLIHYQTVITEANKELGGGAKTIDLKVNAIEKGSFSNIIVPNMGGKGQLGGRNGDLVVRLYVNNTGKYRIKDKNHPRNIYTTIDCKYSDLVLGNTFTLDAYCGKIDVVVPRGTTFDKPIIIKGKGLPYPNSNTYGDLIVELNLEMPKELDKKQEKLINKMKECGL